MVEPPCSASWVSIFWGKCRDLFTKYKAKDCVCVIEGAFPDLPYDILINILTRLPAKCIFQLWQSNSDDDLTATPHFMRTHLDLATPTILVQSFTEYSYDNEVDLFLFDGQDEATIFDLISSCNNNAHCKGPFTLWGSYDGFLLFNSRSGPFCLLNPVTKEQVIVVSPYVISFVCGIYFHPRKKEYELVCVCHLGKQIWDFQILNLRTKHRTSVGSYSYPPSRKRPPAFINGTFYWMVDLALYWIDIFDILSDELLEELPEPEPMLSLNIETGEFGTMEVVELFDDSPQHRKYPEEELHLFEMEGELSLFGTSSTPEVGIWVFNFNEKCWVKKHSITSPDHERHWSFKSYFRDFEYIKKKGEFIAYDRWEKKKQPLIYNLRLGTWKLFESKGFEGDRSVLTSHTHSLVSLDAADPVIVLHVENHMNS